MTEEITIDYEGYKLRIEYSWQPYEPMTHDHPGCSAEVEEITAICLVNARPKIDIFPLIFEIDREGGWLDLYTAVHEAHQDREKSQAEEAQLMREEMKNEGLHS